MLHITSLTKTYPGFQLGPLDLTVENEILTVLGPSGCGKTTLLSTIAGITASDTGTVTLNGSSLDDYPVEERGTVLVFQNGALFPHFTARENIEYAAVPATTINDLAQTLEITEILDQQADTLSGGEAQRVALARALATDPAALLLDEPLANLDAPTKRRLRTDLRSLLSPLDLPVVYVTHDQREASSIGDRIAVLNDGQLQQTGSPSEIFSHPATPFVARFTGNPNVFPAEFRSSSTLYWESVELTIEKAEPSEGDEGWFCVRPELINIIPNPSDSAVNCITGTIVTRLFEGENYRLVITPDGVDKDLEVVVYSTTYDQYNLTDQSRVTISIPPSAIHVSPGTNTSDFKSQST